ncbi:MAG TPA: deoxyribonuclease IV [Candidatus Caldiarchaeum subterraneum]|uniref:Probable endonuclease 4 n=1 Tax=Caldiarchaeum subterraneum TaxID=311458 RepID=A0A832ZUH3_CALS0|nr:deoxyribonuclease IV [Candidatus Caldarchaeum subterraneum]
MLLGVHVSIAGSVDLAVDRAKELGCTTFQIFTRNPRGWEYKKLSKDEVEHFRKKLREYGYEVAMAHMPYLPNIASPKRDIYTKSVRSLRLELERSEQLGLKYLVVHVGSHLGAGIEKGITRVAEACNNALSKADSKTILLLENMAGQKNSCGSLFEDLRRILNKIEYQDRVGICLDTCHLYAAGYDISTEQGIEATLEDFDKIIGLDKLYAIHLNDSKGGLRSGLDRHEHIGMGNIGIRGFKYFINHKAVRDKPMILETPEDERGDFVKNLETIRSLYQP